MGSVDGVIRGEMLRVVCVWKELVLGMDRNVRISEDGECFLLSPAVEGYDQLRATPSDLPWSTHITAHSPAFRMASKLCVLDPGLPPARVVAYVNFVKGSAAPYLKTGLVVDWQDSRAEAFYDTRTREWNVAACQNLDARLVTAVRKVVRRLRLRKVSNPATELPLE